MAAGRHRGSAVASYGVRYAIGISALQVGWVLLLATGWTDPARSIAFGFLVVCELSVPRWAERASTTNWHPHHIAERYGLFTIILLGETVLAATAAVQRTLDADHVSASLVTVAACGLVLVFALWWLYFMLPAGPGLEERREHSYRWGYGHYGIFGALAALGAGLEVAVEQTSHDLQISDTGVSYAVAIPVAVFLVLLWAVHMTISSVPALHRGAVLACTALVLLLPIATPWAGTVAIVAALTLSCVLLTAVTTAQRARD